jgi:signal transduction histidine kinase
MKRLVIFVSILLFIFQMGPWIFGQSGGADQVQSDIDFDKEKQIELNLKRVHEFKNSDIRQAMAYGEQALADAQMLNSQKLIAESKLSLGICYDDIGANPEALDYLNDALSIFTDMNDLQKKASTLKRIGYIYYYSNEFPMALDCFKKVYDLGRELHDSLLLIEGVIGRGSVYGNTNKMDSAMALFNESLDLAKNYGDLAAEVQSFFYIGDVYLYSDRPKKALEVFRHVEDDYDLQKINPDLISGLYNSITRAAIRINVLEMAKHYNKMTLKVLDQNSRLQRKRDYYEYKFQIDTMSGDYKSAVEDYISFKMFYDSINNSEFKRNLANLKIVYELRRKDSEITHLTNENLVKDLKIKQRRLVNFGSISLVLLLSVIIYQILRNGKKIGEKNLVLQSQGEELKAAISYLQNTQKQLIQSEKMAALGVLASGVSHEINNPLNYILGGVQCIKEQCSLHQDQCKSNIDFYVDAISTGVEKVSAIVTGLNRFSRSGESFQKRLDVHNITDTCILMLNYLTHNRIEIVKDYSGSSCIILGDEAKLHQVILSILLNAIQSINSTGIITIKTEIQGPRVIIYISDTGCGISEENLPKIMDPFFTTKDPGEGTGLGLSITYKMLQEHNGTIDFRSVAGKGTTVTISLPLPQGSAGQ